MKAIFEERPDVLYALLAPAVEPGKNRRERQAGGIERYEIVEETANRDGHDRHVVASQFTRQFLELVGRGFRIERWARLPLGFKRSDRLEFRVEQCPRDATGRDVKTK